MRRVSLTAVLLLAACSGQPKSTSGNEVDIANAAEAAQNSVANYGAEPTDQATTDAPAPSDDAAPAPTPTPVASPKPGPDDVVAETPFTPDSAQGAANVVQTYYALLEQGKYRQAWRLWGDGGRASGMSADAFAASFAKYRDYHASVGAPGRIDAGAGQRYVTVPVKPYGHLKAGGAAFTMIGSVTLHRTGDIDGATPEQKSWRINAIDVKSAPGAPDQALNQAVVGAVYRCDGNVRVVARFDNASETATLRIAGAAPVRLAGQRPTSGIWYKGQGYELRGKGDAATLTRPTGAPLSCQARG